MSHKLLKAILFSQVMLVCSSVLCQTNANTNPAAEKEMILQAAQATHSGIPHLPLSKIPIKNFERAYAEIVAEQTDPAVLSKLQCLLFNQVKGAKSHQASSVIVEAITTTIRSNADCASEAIAALPKLEIDKTYKTQVLAEVIRETSRTDIIRSAACMALAKVGSLDNQTKEVLKNVLTSTHASAELQQAAAFAYLKENDNLTAVKDLFSSKIEAMSAVLPNVAVNLYQEAQQSSSTETVRRLNEFTELICMTLQSGSDEVINNGFRALIFLIPTYKLTAVRVPDCLQAALNLHLSSSRPEIQSLSAKYLQIIGNLGPAE